MSMYQPVPESALLHRVRRVLAREGDVRICKLSPRNRGYHDLGDYHLVNGYNIVVDYHVDLEKLARDKGVLGADECVAYA